MNSSAAKGHRFLAIAIPVILPPEADPGRLNGHQAVVGDRNTMGIPPDIVEDLFRPGERPLRIDHPLGVANRRQMTPECGGLVKVAVCGEEVQLAGGESLLQIMQEQASDNCLQ